jgi:hypothetical protein
VSTLGRGRREATFQVLRDGLKAFLETRWKSATHDDLPLQPGRQLIFLS